MTSNAKTLSEKVWDRHVVHSAPGEPDLLYIDLHLVHEVTSPQAFDGLRLAGRPVRRPDLTIATADHNVPTIHIDQPIADPISATQVAALDHELRTSSASSSIPMGDPGQGIVHVIGPELGLTLPGMTIVCGDSHTSTHGAFGALAFGIGTSEVEHVLATQTPAAEAAEDDGDHRRRRAAGRASTAKDVILAIIGKIGTGGGIGHDHRVPRLDDPRPLDGRADDVCNMSIEAGARAGMVAPDDTTFAYIEGRPHAPQGRALGAGARRLAVAADRRRRDVRPRGRRSTARAIRPHVSWGTNPGSGRADRRRRARSRRVRRSRRRAKSAARALKYMGLKPGTPMREIAVDTVFIGSCTNSRIEDLRLAASVVAGRQVATGRAGDGGARLDAGAGPRPRPRGWTASSRDAGFEWRAAGCSMCLGMNPDKLRPGERCASTIEPQLRGAAGTGRPHAPVSPAVAARDGASPGTFADAGGSEVEAAHDNLDAERPSPARAACRWTAATSTPTRSSRRHWLKRVERTGFGVGLFSAWRESDPDFVLNRPEYAGGDDPRRRAELRHRLVARARRLGADGLRLPGGHLAALRRHLPQQRDQVRAGAGRGRAGVRRGAAARGRGRPDARDHDRRARAGRPRPAPGSNAEFPLDDFTRYRLLEGLDDIGLSLRHADEITAYEARRPAWMPAVAIG